MTAIERLAAHAVPCARVPSPGARDRRVWRTALAVVAMLALLWQGFLTQTHGHHHAFGAPSGPLAHGGGHGPSAGDHHRSKAPEDCPVCRAIAQAGHYLSPAAPTQILPPPPVRTDASPPRARATADARQARSRIRGPPIPAHA